MQPSAPSRTALRVALRRAAHQLYDERPLVIEDPLAVRILGDTYRQELARTPDKLRRPFSAALRAWLVCRSRFAEDTLAGAVALGCSQYLVLGAGLDTFAYRNPHPGLAVFEVDHPATQIWKLRLLSDAAIPIPPGVRHVPVDFETESLAERLADAGFRTDRPAFVGWLGVVPYLTLEAFRSTVDYLGTLPAGSGLVFDYSLPRSALPPLEQLALDSLASRVKQAGEPFQLFFTPDEAASELGRADLHVVEDLNGPAITRRYLASRTDGLALRGSGGRLIHARR